MWCRRRAGCQRASASARPARPHAPRASPASRGHTKSTLVASLAYPRWQAGSESCSRVRSAARAGGACDSGRWSRRRCTRARPAIRLRNPPRWRRILPQPRVQARGRASFVSGGVVRLWRGQAGATWCGRARSCCGTLQTVSEGEGAGRNFRGRQPPSPASDAAARPHACEPWLNPLPGLPCHSGRVRKGRGARANAREAGQVPAAARRLAVAARGGLGSERAGTTLACLQRHRRVPGNHRGGVHRLAPCASASLPAARGRAGTPSRAHPVSPIAPPPPVPLLCCTPTLALTHPSSWLKPRVAPASDRSPVRSRPLNPAPPALPG